MEVLQKNDYGDLYTLIVYLLEQNTDKPIIKWYDDEIFNNHSIISLIKEK